jgi:hypothetical protein
MNTKRTVATRCALLFLLLACVPGAHAQQCLSVEFECDGRPMSGRFRIEMEAGGKRLNPQLCGQGFIVPESANAAATVAVHFEIGDQNLFFDPIYRVNLHAARWLVGIDRKPFEPRNLSASRPTVEAEEIWSVEFEPKNGGDGTIMRVYVAQSDNPPCNAPSVRSDGPEVDPESAPTTK